MTVSIPLIAIFGVLVYVAYRYMGLRVWHAIVSPHLRIPARRDSRRAGNPESLVRPHSLAEKAVTRHRKDGGAYDQPAPHSRIDLEEITARNQTARHMIAGFAIEMPALAEFWRDLATALADSRAWPPKSPG